MSDEQTPLDACPSCYADLPRTDAGRAVVAVLHSEDWEFWPPTNGSIEDAIIAIEREASGVTPDEGRKP